MPDKMLQYYRNELLDYDLYKWKYTALVSKVSGSCS